MRLGILAIGTLWTLGLVATQACAQEAEAVPAGAVATVNGQPISQLALDRGLKRQPPDKQAQARTEILNVLIDNVLLDQYLLQMKIDVSKPEVDTRVEQIKAELKKQGQTFDKLLQELQLSEEELREQLTAEARWEKYLNTQATDKVLQEVFTKNLEMFDGTMVRARHLLLTPAAGDATATETTKAHLLEIKKSIEEEAAKAVAKLPADADNLLRAKTRARALEDAFAEAARKESTCPSKEQGGDLGWFPRSGSMVETFARAAFLLKDHELSEPVQTPFGYHLILATDRRPGKETKFEDIKDVVKDVYGDRLRDYLCGQLRPRSKIVIRPETKP